MLQRCLVMHQSPELLPVGPLDLVLTVPALPGANFMDFDRHFEVFEAAYQWCRRQIEQLTDEGNPALAANSGDQGLSRVVTRLSANQG